MVPGIYAPLSANGGSMTRGTIELDRSCDSRLRLWPWGQPVACEKPERKYLEPGGTSESPGSGRAHPKLRPRSGTVSARRGESPAATTISKAPLDLHDVSAHADIMGTLHGVAVVPVPQAARTDLAVLPQAECLIIQVRQREVTS